MAMVNGGILAGRALKVEGVDCVFTLCGGHISPVYEGCLEQDIRIIDVRHEQSAVHAAEGYARITRKPGVALVTAGPGVTDGVTGLANAHFASSPVFMIAGRSPLLGFERGYLQEMDHVRLVEPVTKWARTVYQTQRIPEYISIGMRHMLSGRTGPAFLDIPQDILYSMVDEDDAPVPRDYRSDAKLLADPSVIDRAAQLLSKAERPLIMAGSSVWWHDACDELDRLARALDAPVYVNGMARGALPPDHPNLHVLSRRWAIGQADVAMVIGSPFDFRLSYGRSPVWPDGGRVVQVDIDPGEIGRNRPVDAGLVGHTDRVLQQLLSALPERSSAGGAWHRQVREQEARMLEEQAALETSDNVPIHPLRLAREMQEYLPDDTTVIGDGGDVVGFAGRVIKVHRPGHWLDPGPFGCLGVGTGYAMAAQVCRPGSPVCILFGDGSFGLNGMEFDTFARFNLPVVGVIGNDGAWGQIKHPHQQMFGHAPGMDLDQGTRYDIMVESLGGYGETVVEPGDIKGALERAYSSGKPALVNVLTDPTVSAGLRGY
ncbi:MAG: acetolactate synthase [Candidatus Dormibacteria bacterium]